jgi:hypothetical protein
MAVVIITFVPILFAQRLTSDTTAPGVTAA